MNPAECKRLIEVDLPIRVISKEARREKSIRHGHISTLHLWWARRPLAACRAVVLAALWPDPADPNCPDRFRTKARDLLRERWAERDLTDPLALRKALFDFIAEFSNWDLASKELHVRISRALVREAHEALGGEPDTAPMVLDPFAGGGAIPLEALRVGAEAIASDLNPVAVMLNKVQLEYIPRYGKRLAAAVRKWGAWVKAEAEKELARFYPTDDDGNVPIAYLWARTIRCEGPGCGVEVPLLRSTWLSRTRSGKKSIALEFVPGSKPLALRLSEKHKGEAPGTAQGGHVTCPACRHTTRNPAVRAQLVAKHGGADGGRLFCVVTVHPDRGGRVYRLPRAADLDAKAAADLALAERLDPDADGSLADFIPDETIPQEKVWKNNPVRVHLYGMTRWSDLFNRRQLLALATLSRIVASNAGHYDENDPSFDAAIRCCLASAIDRSVDKWASLNRWNAIGEKIENVFGRQALSFLWDYAEGNPFSDSTGNWTSAIEWVAQVCDVDGFPTPGRAFQANAAEHPYPDDSFDAVVTDPPYYDAVPYATLSDFFYVWMRRLLAPIEPSLFREALTPKLDECVFNPVSATRDGGVKDEGYFRRTMAAAMSEARRVTKPEGIAVVVFAHKSTVGWEAQLESMIEAGWIITSSWPIDTERGARLRAMDSAALASSIHLVCRPRENADGSLRTDLVGEWRDVVQQLPARIESWLPRLAAEDIVGADAIFACLGPALEIYSRYANVVRANGKRVRLREYLEVVWAEVSRQALSTIFKGVDASAFEGDARLTAMWLWTLSAADAVEEIEGDEDDDDGPSPSASRSYVLDYDTARKIAMGLGVELGDIPDIVEVKGDVARLRSVEERETEVFQAHPRKKKDDDAQPPLAGMEDSLAMRTLPSTKVIVASSRHESGTRSPSELVLPGFESELLATESSARGRRAAGMTEPKLDVTILGRLHQSMLMFHRGRTEGLRDLLVERGYGRDARLWTLAQSLAALYPKGSAEKRMVDGVMARKKALGL